MSITLGDKVFTTKKTVGEINETKDNVLVASPCESLIDINNLQPKFKTINRQNLGTFNATYTGVQWELDKSMINAAYVDLFEPLSDLVNGYDYQVIINWNLNLSNPSAWNQGRFRFTYSYNYSGGITLFDVVSGTPIQISELTIGNDYDSASSLLDIFWESTVDFSIDIEVELRQLLPAKLRKQDCNGNFTDYDLEMNVVLVEETDLWHTDSPEEAPDSVPTRTVSKRGVVYDPLDLGVEEIAKLSGTCVDYEVHYESLAKKSGAIANEYYLDSGIYETKINIPITPQQQLSFKYWDGSNYIFDELSDLDGLVNWTAFIPVLSGTSIELHVYDGATQQSTTGTQYVSYAYDKNTYECPCSCVEPCEEETIVKFYQSCNDIISLKLRLMVQDGRYISEGEKYYQNEQYIKPITKNKAVYDLVIDGYSDEVYLLILELISENIEIGIVDNIDTGSPETFYIIDLEQFNPAWNYNSKEASLTIPIIKKDTISTKRLNCCN